MYCPYKSFFGLYPVLSSDYVSWSCNMLTDYVIFSIFTSLDYASWSCIKLTDFVIFSIFTALSKNNGAIYNVLETITNSHK